jgi:N-dimethylarginine dimethylaminohydrolase
MGKPDRRGEVPALGDSLRAWGVPVLGAIEGEGTAEAGDMIWLDEATLLVGRGFRTNAEGIRQLAVLLGPMGIDIVPLHLPYDNGPGKVLHLMSFISLLDLDLAIVCRRLLPVPLYEILTDRGVRLVDVPDAEYATMGTNVLALGPRNLVMVSGNPVTRERLEAAGCQVTEIEGRQICIPGAGGPTCLTRPIWRK